MAFTPHSDNTSDRALVSIAVARFFQTGEENKKVVHCGAVPAVPGTSSSSEDKTTDLLHQAHHLCSCPVRQTHGRVTGDGRRFEKLPQHPDLSSREPSGHRHSQPDLLQPAQPQHAPGMEADQDDLKKINAFKSSSLSSSKHSLVDTISAIFPVGNALLINRVRATL